MGGEGTECTLDKYFTTDFNPPVQVFCYDNTDDQRSLTLGQSYRTEGLGERVRDGERIETGPPRKKDKESSTCYCGFLFFFLYVFVCVYLCTHAHAYVYDCIQYHSVKGHTLLASHSSRAAGGLGLRSQTPSSLLTEFNPAQSAFPFGLSSARIIGTCHYALLPILFFFYSTRSDIVLYINIPLLLWNINCLRRQTHSLLQQLVSSSKTIVAYVFI